MIYFRLACFDKRGHLSELEEFGLAVDAWEAFNEQRHKHSTVTLDEVDAEGILFHQLASCGAPLPPKKFAV